MLSELKSVTAAYPVTNRADTTPPAASTDTASTADSAATKAAQQTELTTAPSPRITVDPSAGVILQFLDSKGQIEAQSPSFAAVAYLRAGLTRDGESKTATNEPSAALTA